MRTRLRMASAVAAGMFGLMLIAPFELEGQQAHLAIAPARPLPGAIVRLSLTEDRKSVV